MCHHNTFSGNEDFYRPSSPPSSPPHVARQSSVPVAERVTCVEGFAQANDRAGSAPRQVDEGLSLFEDEE